MVALKPPNSAEEADQLVDSAFAQAMHASRSAVNSELQWHTPGSMAFGRDMFLDIPMLVDVLSLHKARQLKIDGRLLKANASMIPVD